MQIADKYAPQEIEQKWYDYWERHGLFHSEPDAREPYTIVIPPPNVTGMLHMGHMLNNTLQDVLIRRARMQGKNACWVPGMDHASIATEAKVVAKLKERGIEKSSLTREKFLEYAWEWKEQYGGVILRQLRKLGASCDWDRTCFTMDDIRTEGVIKVFCDLYRKGRIYRGVRMVNWDPAARTALSDEEVVFKESHGKLYYLRYAVEGTDKYLVVATTRPETILGDTALCVNPDDERYEWLPQDARVVVPLVGRSIPVIRDTYVDIAFGTGALKVTPAHDVNDYMLGEKYGLETIDIFNDDGTINGKVGIYEGMDRFELRRVIEGDLQRAGLLEKTEEYTNNVGYSERTGVAIEPKLSMQWFLSMEELAKPATRAVMEDEIRFVPEKYKNIYRHWMENFGSDRLSEAFMLLDKLFWADFSGWYLEMIKPAYGAPIDPRTVDEAKGFFDALLRLLHPFMPFVTEEIWQDLAPRAAGESIMVARQPQADGQAEEALLARFELVKETITAVRNIRKQKNLPQREALTLEVIADANYPADYAPVLTKMANLSAIERVAEKDAAAAAFIVKTTQYFVPLGDRIDREAEIAKLGEELTYYEGFLQSVERKLSNERFVQSAPAAVVDKERAKKADAEAKIAAIREQLAALN